MKRLSKVNLKIIFKFPYFSAKCFPVSTFFRLIFRKKPSFEERTDETFVNEFKSYVLLS